MPAKPLIAYRAWRETRSIHRFERRHVTHHYAERELTLLLADRVGESWYDKDWQEPAEIATLRKGQLRPGATVFNAGAHQGVVAMMLAERVGPTGKVVAVELNQHNAEVAEWNARKNQFENLLIVHAAVGQGSAPILTNGNLNGQVTHRFGATTGQMAAMITIDELTLEHGVPQVLYVDVEGYEAQVLAGAKSSLLHQPDCFIEVHVGCGLESFGGTVDEILTYFPADRFERMCAREGEPFQPLATCPPHTIEGRFYLIAIAR